MIKRWSVPGIPFAVSLCLSLATVGTHPFWQDSGYYLTAVKDLGVLYPPGFVVYEVLCFLWTRLFFFLDFTLAVHLFSSFCAALAAGTMAVAARDLLLSRGRIFGGPGPEPGDLADACGIAAGVLLACGYTFWSAAIYAKGYALFYLIMALLLRFMIRADQSGKPRDFTIVAALIGLMWQAHPSAALTGAALVLFVAVHARALGWKGVAGRVGVAAACALGPAVVLLPLLTSRDPWMMMGAPAGVLDAVHYVTGRRFLQIPGAFGVDGARVASFGLFLWEEMLGVGLLLALAGLAAIAARRRLLLWGILAWTIPVATVTILFKLEGQHDYWFVGAWMPLYLAMAVGAWEAGRRAGEHARVIVLAAGVAGAAWATLSNLPDVSQRQYVFAEMYGRILLENVDQDAILLLQGDDANGLAGYLQRVRGARPDVLLVSANYLTSGWYDQLLLRRHPFLRPPQYLPPPEPITTQRLRAAATASFLNSQADLGRPLFCEQFVPLEFIRPDYTLVPAGAVWKLVRKGPPVAPDVKYWRFPIEPEQVPSKARRERGQKVVSTFPRLEVAQQRYEDRLIYLIVMARYHLAIGRMEQGDFPVASRLCESILALDQEYFKSPEIVHLFAISSYAAGDPRKAEPALRRSAEISVLPRNRATACFYLGEIARRKGDEPEAQRWFRQGLSTPGLDDATRREIESRLKAGPR